MEADKKIFGIFVAGGHGTRMGTELPKQFLDLCGRPVLQQTIRRFLEACPEMRIVIVLPKEHFPTWKHLCTETGFDYPQILVEGGITRFHSVKAALAKIPDGATVLIHDAVRPLVSIDLIRSIIGKAQECDAVIPVVPVTDTLKSISVLGDGTLAASGLPDPDRAGIFAAQTPQAFRSEIIKGAYSQGFDTSFTDDASVARKKGIPLTYIPGERYNIKLTTPQDMVVAEKLFN